MDGTYFQDPTLTAAVVGTMLPFLAFGLIVVFTRSRARLSATLSIAAIGVSLGSTLYLLSSHWHMEGALQYTGKWLVSGELVIPFGFMLDPLSLWMFALVALISFLVQVYSLGYMAGDPGFSRYYAFQSLFAWAMLNLTISSSLLQLYVFWELVGLSSYLLIGFWYEKWSATQAGKKAFVMTRLGDIALFLGLLLVLSSFGNLNILELNGPEVNAHMSSGLITLSVLLIFGGIIGKSAQFPLLTWLPDAMEGPTPVSALLHSATMVAAGVYLFSRLFPFFSHSPEAMAVCLTIGTITLLLASTMAIVARDIKQVWAYSTISQLGFMIMGISAGGYTAEILHLSTHAWFKALLFLCSGMLIHAYGTNDLFELSRRGRRRLGVPLVCMTLGAASLAGLPLLSGFFSKEAILGALSELDNPVWLMAGLLGAFLTSYYAFRVCFILLFPRNPDAAHEQEEERPGHDHHAGNRDYWLMAWPVIFLTAGTVLLGFFQKPLDTFWLSVDEGLGEVGGHPSVGLMFVALAAALCGIGLAWVEFGRRGADQVGFVEKIAPLRSLFAERWYLDHLYRRMLDTVIYGGFSRLFAANDRKVIDGSVDGFARLTAESGGLLSRLQTAWVQRNLLVLFAVLTLMALFFFL